MERNFNFKCTVKFHPLGIINSSLSSEIPHTSQFAEPAISSSNRANFAGKDVEQRPPHGTNENNRPNFAWFVPHLSQQNSLGWTIKFFEPLRIVASFLKSRKGQAIGP